MTKAIVLTETVEHERSGQASGGGRQLVQMVRRFGVPDELMAPRIPGNPRPNICQLADTGAIQDGRPVGGRASPRPNSMSPGWSPRGSATPRSVPGCSSAEEL